MLLWSDLALLAAGAIGWSRARHVLRHRAGHRRALAGAALGLCLLTAFAAHPSDRRILALLRWFGTWASPALVPGVTKLGLRRVVSTAGLVSALQVLVALLERGGNAPGWASAGSASPRPTRSACATPRPG